MSAAFASSGFSTTSFSPSAFAFDSQKKKGGSGGGRLVFDTGYADAIRLARMDQQDLLDIVTIIGFALSRIDD